MSSKNCAENKLRSILIVYNLYNLTMRGISLSIFLRSLCSPR